MTGAIVAGGSAERFGGQPKGLRSVGGVRIIDRVATALRSVTPNLVLIANAPDAELWLPGVRVRRDERRERGSIVAVHSALAGIGPADVVLVLAWDMPFASGELLAFLLTQARAGASAAIPEGPDGPEPFCAAYTRACLPAIESAIDRGEFRMSSLVAALPNTTRVSEADVRKFGDPARLFFNVNDAADLETAERMFGP